MSNAGSANLQGEWWGRRAGDWSSVQEPTAVPLYEAALSRLRIGPGTRVLDAGCGAGLFAGMAAGRGAAAVGIDVSEALILAARERFPEARFETADLETLPFEECTFDAVTGFNVFQYSERPSQALAEAVRVLRFGGRILIAAWGDPEDCEAMGYVDAVNSFLPSGAVPPGVRAFSEPGSLEALAAASSLSPVEHAEIDVPFVYPDLETAVRGVLSAGPAARAIDLAGGERVREAVERALAPYRLHAGDYRLENRFRYVVFARVS